MKHIFSIIVIFATVFSLSAQTANDAITFGQVYQGGTARYMSMGGAFNALGGDFSTLSVNPAGIGVYRSGEFTTTVDLRFNNTTTGYSEGQKIDGATYTPIEDTKSNFNFNSIGYVQGVHLADNGLIRLNFGFGYNRLKNFYKAYRAEVLNSSHSLTDDWASSLYLNGISGATTGAYVANQSYLINSAGNAGESDFSPPLYKEATSDYIKDVVEKGRINEWVFSVGGNIDDFIYFGVTLGIQDVKMTKEYYQTEYFVDGTSGVAYQRFSGASSDTSLSTTGRNDNFCYYSEEKTDGVGLNAKFGVIVRPMDNFRFGVAVHTPTVQYLNVEHYADITNNTVYYNEFYECFDPCNGDEPGRGFEEPESYDYRTISPYKLHADAAVVIGKCLALDIEGDMIDYSTMKIKDDGGRSYAYQTANDAIKEMYKIAYNARLGAEFKPDPAFALRAGFAYFGSPYKDNISYDDNGEMLDAADYKGDRFDYSAGLGFRGGDFFMDLSYIHSVQKNRTMVFDDAIDIYEFYEMDLDHKVNRFMMTLGFKF